MFLLLGLLHPAERFARIQRGLASASPKAKASSRELLENVLVAPLRDRVLTVVDDIDDGERLSKIGSARTETTYPALLAAMIEQGGEVGVLAVYHASELGLRDALGDAAARVDASTTVFGADLSARDLGQTPLAEAGA